MVQACGYCSPIHHTKPSKLSSKVRSYFVVRLLIMWQIYPSTDDIVSAYFKENFFTPDPTGMTGQLSGTENASSVLHQALLSLGTLSIANNYGSYDDTQRARQRYGIALRHANASLRNECTATNDDTLSGILLLAMFEVRSTKPMVCDVLADFLNSVLTAGIMTTSINGRTTSKEPSSSCARGTVRSTQVVNLAHSCFTGFELSL